MVALHIWTMAHGVASLFGRGDGGQRALPMTPDELLEAQMLVYLRGLGVGAPRRGRFYLSAAASPLALDNRALACKCSLHSRRRSAMKIMLMVLGFIWWWPVGLVVLGCLIARDGGLLAAPMYAGRWPMRTVTTNWIAGSIKSLARRKRWSACAPAWSDTPPRGGWIGSSTSGNHAFDEYRSETLKRLEDEQREFKDFLGRLRFAKDRAEFDQFMAERRVGRRSPTRRASRRRPSRTAEPNSPPGWRAE